MFAVYQRLLVLALGGLTCATASCALLVSYDGFRADPSDSDGGDATDDARADGGDASRRDAEPDDGSVCNGVVPGVYCGRSLPGYSGGAQDLVHCRGDGTKGAVAACDAGCASMPDGRQDVCNACPGRADGPYCLQEIVVDYPENDVLVLCGGGATSRASLCPKGCVASTCR